jgi:hypothetical protein
MVLYFTRNYLPASSQEFQAAYVTAASRTISLRLPNGRIMILDFPNHRVVQGDWRSGQLRFHARDRDPFFRLLVSIMFSIFCCFSISTAEKDCGSWRMVKFLLRRGIGKAIGYDQGDHS